MNTETDNKITVKVLLLSGELVANKEININYQVSNLETEISTLLRVSGKNIDEANQIKFVYNTKVLSSTDTFNSLDLEDLSILYLIFVKKEPKYNLITKSSDNKLHLTKIEPKKKSESGIYFQSNYLGTSYLDNINLAKEDFCILYWTLLDSIINYSIKKIIRVFVGKDDTIYKNQLRLVIEEMKNDEIDSQLKHLYFNHEESIIKYRIFTVGSRSFSFLDINYNYSYVTNDGKKIVFLYYSKITIVDIDSLEITTLKISDESFYIKNFDISRCNNFIATFGSDNIIKIWLITSNSITNHCIISDNFEHIKFISLNFDSSILAVGTSNEIPSVLLYSIPDGNLLYNIIQDSIPSALCFSSNNLLVIGYEDCSVKFWYNKEYIKIIPDFRITRRYEDYRHFTSYNDTIHLINSVRIVIFSPDELYLFIIYGDGNIGILDISTDELIFQMSNHNYYDTRNAGFLVS